MVIRDYVKEHLFRKLPWLAAVTVLVLLSIAACGGEDAGEDRPTIQVIDETGSTSISVSASASASGSASGTGSASVSGTPSGSVSVSGAAPASGSVSVSAAVPPSGSVSVSAAVPPVAPAPPAPAAAMTPGAGAVVVGRLFIPAGITASTTGNTTSDGIYTPVSNREIYMKIASDYQEIVALTNLVNLGKEFPAPEILLLYETGNHARIGSSSRTLRGFARDPRRSTEFPEAAAFYDSDTFLDSPISNAIRGRGSAEEYTPAQRRQAIQKSLLRVLYHWSKRYMFLGGERMSPGLVDEAWAVYVGLEVKGEYPNSLAGAARNLEVSAGREGTIDTPLREAMARAQQAAGAMDAAAYDVAASEVYSRYNAIFYLNTVRYMSYALQYAQAGNDYAAGAALAGGLHSYRSIQPDVANASATADQTIIAFFESGPSGLTAGQRNAALAALNGTASALSLGQADLVTSSQADMFGNPDMPGDGLGVTSGLLIPAGLVAETSGNTKSDGIYTPVSNREIYMKISSDYQEIVALTDVVKSGQPLPAAEILLLYEAGMHSRIGSSSRTLRGFARDPRRSTEFPDAAAYYDSGTFLDSPISASIRGRGDAAEYTPAQRRQAIQKGLLRIIYHWSKRYMFLGGERMSPGLVDEAWAVYVGEEVNGEYPNSLAATARKREANFGRQGTIDIPLREAMARAQQAAEAMDAAAYEVAANDVYSRYNAIFYLGTVRYMNEALKHAQAGDGDASGTAAVEGLAFYMSIQPDVAKASTSADEAMVAYFQLPPDELTAGQRDAALAALNGTAATALLLTADDLVTSFQ